MRRLPFGFLAGALIAAILALALVAVWLAVSLIDEREASLRATEIAWPTATSAPATQPAVMPFFLTPTITAMPPTPLAQPTQPPVISTSTPELPAAHPTYEPNLDCLACHQTIHKGGG